MSPQTVDSFNHIDAAARGWADWLETRERWRGETSRIIARRTVARRIGIAPGSLENLARGRGKGLRGWVRDKIHQTFCRELEAEIANLSHLLALARHGNSGASVDAIRDAEAALANARALIRGARP